MTRGTTPEPTYDAAYWDAFIDRLVARGPLPPPHPPVVRLLSSGLPAQARVLDVGCETGKNALLLLQNGHRVTLVDMAPKALAATHATLAAHQLLGGIDGRLVASIQDLPPAYGPFDAVVGTYAFAFIPPSQFATVMRRNVLGRVRPGGFFAGSFFGSEHGWAAQSQLTLQTPAALRNLFGSMNFTVQALDEEREPVPTVDGATILFHTLDVVAQRAL